MNPQLRATGQWPATPFEGTISSSLPCHADYGAAQSGWPRRGRDSWPTCSSSRLLGRLVWLCTLFLPGSKVASLCAKKKKKKG
jgi:hypothetical protein